MASTAPRHRLTSLAKGRVHSIVTSAAMTLTLSLCSAAAQAATPKVYVFKGTDSNCDVATINTPFRNMIGRTEDGDLVFVDQSHSPDYAYTNVDWEVGCYKGQVANIALGVPLAFPQPSAGLYSIPAGDNTLADTAAGKLDLLYQHMAAVLVAGKFPNAYIRLGWEFNGNWQPWSAGSNKAVFNAAFAHVAAIFKSTPGSHFTVILNPSINNDASGEFPSSGADNVGWDVYKTQWAINGATAEPTQYNNALNGWWGISSMASWYGSLPHAAPEFGVGGGYGDDGVFMAQALTYFTNQKAAFVGYWDSSASYDGIISNGSKPAEALEYLKVFGPGNMPTTLAGARLYTGPFSASITQGVGMHSLLIQLANGRVGMVFWGDTAAAQQIAITMSSQMNASSISWLTGKTSSLGVKKSLTMVYSSATSPGFIEFQ